MAIPPHTKSIECIGTCSHGNYKVVIISIKFFFATQGSQWGVCVCVSECVRERERDEWMMLLVEWREVRVDGMC
ncbi:hypothetical protein LguiB_001959 [Lonicera macranthoides]